jgi:6-pyruvoyltetrahydropterin/6-carboxytetrahydropterin synthase
VRVLTYQVTTEIDFSYGHRLLDYNGKCAHPHGHNGRVQIELASESLNAAGMAVDFTVVKHVVQRWVNDHIDHKMVLRKDDPLLRPLHELGEPVYVMEQNPTAENLARLLYEVASNEGLPVTSVRFWESPTSYATFAPTTASNNGRSAGARNEARRG